MVVIQIKQSEHDTFLYETTCSATNDQVVREIVEIWNLRLRIAQLTGGLKELAQYGPMKEPEKAGLDKIDEEYKGIAVDRGPYYVSDPTGLRNGNGVGPQLMQTFEMVIRDAEDIISKENASRKIAINKQMLLDRLDNMRGCVMMAFPMGLPEWDTVRLTIEGEAGLDGSAAGQQLLNPDTAELWIASRCLDRAQLLGERLGKNEKTKVIAKLQKPGAGAPGREPGISEEEKKAMMAYYFKKQEEQKKLAENNEDEYLNSTWADSKSLQRSLRGQSDKIRAPGIL